MNHEKIRSGTISQCDRQFIEKCHFSCRRLNLEMFKYFNIFCKVQEDEQIHQGKGPIGKMVIQSVRARTCKVIESKQCNNNIS